ncbi:CASP-like protein [Drosera capensis]
MEMERSGGEKSNYPRPTKISNASQIFLRLFAVVSSAISAYFMFTSSEETLVYDLAMSAKYSYSPAFKFEAYINVAACVFGLISSIITWVAIRKGNPNTYFFLFLHDLVVMSLILAGCSAAAAIGYVGKNGFEEAGWGAICDHFGAFCNRVTISIILGLASAIFFLLLSIISVINSRHIHIIPSGLATTTTNV